MQKNAGASGYRIFDHEKDSSYHKIREKYFVIQVKDIGHFQIRSNFSILPVYSFIQFLHVLLPRKSFR